MKGRELCSSKLYKYNNLVQQGDITYTVADDYVMNLKTKQRLNFLNSEQKAEGCKASNFIAKKDFFYWLVLNKEGARFLIGKSEHFSETSIEYISINHEKLAQEMIYGIQS